MLSFENSTSSDRRRQRTAAHARDGRRHPCRARDRAARGGPDVVVNSAALFERTPFAAATPAQYDRPRDVNPRGAFFCAQAAARVMIDGGHIVNIGDAGASGPPTLPTRCRKSGSRA